MNMITDGTSNTLLVGEKWMYTGWYNVRTSGPGSCIDNEGWPNGWDNDTIGFSGTISYQTTNLYSGNQYVVVPMPDGMQWSDTGNSWGCGWVFGSAHVGKFGCLLCDGSVRFVSYSINPTAWHNLCSRNDGQPLDPSALD